MSQDLLLFVVNNPAFFLTHRLPVARMAQSEGYRVEVAAPPGPGQDQVTAEGFAFHPIHLHRRSLNPIRESQSVRSLLQLYRRIKPALVHHVTIKPVIYGSVAARIAHVRSVVNAVTGLGWTFTGNGTRTRLVRWGVTRAYRAAFRHPNQRTIFQNPDDRNTFLQLQLLQPTQTALIRGSGIDTNHYTPLPEPEGTPLAVVCARLLRDKGIAEFVQAAQSLRQEGLYARFAVVGTPDPGNPSAIPTRQRETWQRDGAVEWWGHRSDLRDVWRQAHIACLPSYREGLPKVLLEAAACSRPLIATDVPGCREIVTPQTGLLVPPRDPAALADALRTLLTDPARRARLGAQARRLVETEFNDQIVADQTRRVYQELTAAAH